MRRLLAIFATVLTVLALLPAASQAQSQQTTSVRVMHASPDAPNVDVFVNDELVLGDVPYFTVSEQLALPGGLYRIQVAPVGAGAEAAFLDSQVELDAGKAYTIAVIGRANAPILLPLEDDLSAPPEGQARVRVFHVSPDAGTVDLRVADQEVPFLTDQGFATADYVNLPAGTWRFDLINSATDEDLLRTLPFRLEPGWTYTLAITGAGSGDPWVQAVIDQVR
jgi:hypothetical protein